ncbi:TetR/AcrR family transcriptional regulator [Clostridiaceae bacterium M8S5]|nr:TetR/AcrR family transcriptional regulator [Clostridiaceae bacterium M8S5]
MNKNFKNIDPKKKDTILNSALTEFALKHYEEASFDSIAQKAGVSKEELCHYFKDKDEMYEYIERFVYKTMINAIEDGIDWEESDLLERIKQVALIKLEVTKKYPEIQSFINVIMEKRTVQELKEKAEDIMPELICQIYNKNIDYSKFKDIDVSRAINTIRWTIEKMSEEYFNKAKKLEEDIDMQKAIAEMDKYLDLFREVLYS